jgi:hypothetical protein
VGYSLYRVDSYILLLFDLAVELVVLVILYALLVLVPVILEYLHVNDIRTTRSDFGSIVLIYQVIQ